MPEDMNEAVSDILESGGDSLPDDIMVAAVENYVKHFNNGDYEGALISLLRRQPLKTIGTPIKNGKAEIKEFYKMSTQLGAQLALNGPVRAPQMRQHLPLA